MTDFTIFQINLVQLADKRTTDLQNVLEPREHIKGPPLATLVFFVNNRVNPIHYHTCFPTIIML